MYLPCQERAIESQRRHVDGNPALIAQDLLHVRPRESARPSGQNAEEGLDVGVGADIAVAVEVGIIRTGGAAVAAQARKEGEYHRLLEVLGQCDNNRSQAARALGISRAALYKKLLSFGIS